MRKIIIAGSRDITDFDLVKRACRSSGFFTTELINAKEIEIVSGGAKGVDSLGEYLAKRAGFHLKFFPADWVTYGKAAGPIRNKQMGDYADCLIAIRLDNSKGTTHMIEYMIKLGKPVYVLDL